MRRRGWKSRRRRYRCINKKCHRTLIVGTFRQFRRFRFCQHCGLEQTLVNCVKQMEPHGNVARVSELLNQTNEILRDAVLPLRSVRLSTKLPRVRWRTLKYGRKCNGRRR
jgi:hypothetical protein